jgi:hypothetical protein
LGWETKVLYDILGILQSWWTDVVSWAVSALSDDYFRKLLDALHYRLTGPPLFKVALLLVSLWIALRVIGMVNGIKGGGGKWPKRPDDPPMRVVESSGLHTNHGSKVRLPRDEDASKYRDLSGTIEFRLHQEDPPPWWKRIFGLGRPRLLLKQSCTFTIPIAGPVNRDQILVDQTSASLIAEGNHPQGAKWRYLCRLEIQPKTRPCP